MELVIYRNRNSNQITNFHEVTATCTEEAMQNYNNNPNNPKVEIVELDEIAQYFYELKSTRNISEEVEELRDIMNDLSRIADRIDERLYDIDEWIRENEDN